jgi:hypothetical protein
MHTSKYAQPARVISLTEQAAINARNAARVDALNSIFALRERWERQMRAAGWDREWGGSRWISPDKTLTAEFP